MSISGVVATLTTQSITKCFYVLHTVKTDKQLDVNTRGTEFCTEYLKLVNLN